MSTKVSTGFGWLEDDVTGDPTGVRRHSDGKEFTIPLVETDPVTGKGVFSADEAAILSNIASTSNMWLGDSLTMGANNNFPLGSRYVRRSRQSPTLSNINSAGLAVRYLNAAETCPTGAGTLRFYAADKSFSWQANGQTEGPRVPAPNGGFVSLESGSAGAAVGIAVIARLYPASDKSDSVTVAEGTRTRASISSFSGMTTAMLGCPFDPEYNFAISGQTAADCLRYADQWSSIKTDITHIALGTNGCTSLDAAAEELAAIKAIIKLRLKLGSRVIVGGLMPYTGATATWTGARQWYDAQLREYCRKIGVEYWSAYRYLCAQDGTDAYRATMSDDGLHPNMTGAFVAAKYGSVPAFKRLLREVNDKAFVPKLYDATLAPFGSLTPNPYLTGTNGSKSGAGVSGDIPTSFTVSAGTNVLAACKTPSSASPVARTDGVPGSWFQLLITSTAAGSVSVYPSALPDWSMVNVGDYISLEGEFYISGSGAIAVSSTVGKYLSAFESAAASLADGPTILDGGVLQFPFRSLPILVTAAMAASANLGVTISVANDANLDVRIGAPFFVRKVPAPE